jgi:LysR family nitrogen assimilation transcriptional regulator
VDVRQLRYFVRIIETRSFSKAAQILRVAQPALGLQIRKLEEELGTQLLVRHSRGVEPTEAGLVLLRNAQEILARIDATVQELRDFAGAPRGKIVLGMTPSVSVMLAATLLRRCAELLPEVSLILVEEVSSVLIEWVDTDRLDMTFAYKLAETRGLTFEPLVVEDIFFVASPGSPGDRPGPITLAEVARHKLIMPGAPHGLRQLLEEAAQRLGVTLDTALEMRSVATTLHLVEQRLGNTVLPYGAARREVEEGRLVARPIEAPRIARTLYLVYSNRRPLSKPELAIRGLVRQLVADEIARSQGIWVAPQGAADAAS